MALTVGTRLGAYEIINAIGAGGMGEVYRARDTRLKREVAVKVLPEAFAHDAERLARFQREAELLATLNHPHIASVYGLEEADGLTAIVLELVEGDTLADRIARGPLPLDEALSIARQVAEAFEAAHEKGIVHRDLKPANIALTKDGRVKVLDFGLAKAIDPALSTDLSKSPTLTFAATQAGVILGTAAYMSPEQAKGRAADKRSDVWAFGCVLYEMLSGRRAFQGEDVSDTLATVLKSEPDWNALPSNVSQAVRALIQGCLRKDRKERIGDISTAIFLLNQPHAVMPAAMESQPPPPSVWRRAMFVAAGVLIGAAAAAAVFMRPKLSPPGPVSRFVFTLPQGQQLTLQRQAVAFSPDGSRLAYAADGRLYLRSMSELEAREILLAEPAIAPVFSPDGQSLLYWTDSKLKRIAITGGATVTVCQTAPAPSGITWGDDAILFPQTGVGVVRVSPNGGKPEVLVGLSNSDGLAHGPQLLPGGQTLLFTVLPPSAAADRWDKASVVAHSLKTGERKTLIEGGTDGRYVPTGHLVYASGGTLFAVPFDLAKLEVTAGPVPIVEGVRRATAASAGSAHFAFSNSGSLAYLAGPASLGQQDLYLFDRKGGAAALKLPPGSYAYPRMSPDGKRVAFETSDGKEMIVSIYELSGASSVRRLTFGGNNRFPIWSADGQRVAFQSDREGDLAVFWQPADGGTPERLTKPDPGTSHVPDSWSPNGETFLFSVTKGPDVSLWTFSLRDRKAMPFDDVRSVTIPTDAAFSPDGRWVAYQTGEPGAGEGTTFVQPFPPSGTKYQIARGGRPVWSRDGKELFYVPAPSLFMSVSVRMQPRFAFTNPVAVPRGFGVADPVSPRTFDVMPDGRIIGVGAAGQSPGGSGGPARIQVVLNWFEELKARAPVR